MERCETIAVFGSHSMNSNKAKFIYRRTKNFRTVQLLHGHAKRKSTLRHLGIEVDDDLKIFNQVGI